MMLISLILQSGANFWGVSHRESGSGCDIYQKLKFGFQKRRMEGARTALRCQGSCYYLYSEWLTGTLAVPLSGTSLTLMLACVNILIGQQPEIRWVWRDILWQILPKDVLTDNPLEITKVVYAFHGEPKGLGSSSVQSLPCRQLPVLPYFFPTAPLWDNVHAPVVLCVVTLMCCPCWQQWRKDTSLFPSRKSTSEKLRKSLLPLKM